MSENPLEILARHVTGTEYGDLPPEAVAAAKTFILDTFGVAIAGGSDPWSRRLPAAAAGWGKGEDASLWGHGGKLPAVQAALVNAHFTHCLEFDCVHERANTHAMAATLSAALAWAEREGGCSGRDLIRAVALGLEAAAFVGEAATAPMRFFRPATAGGFGAVAAVSSLAGLDAERMLDAWGNLYGQMSGTLQPHLEGSPLLAMQMGFNARAALGAVELARAGLAGPHDVLVGPYGYLTLFENDDYDLTPVLARLGKEWQIARVSHKPFPSGRLTHGGIGGVVRLRGQHGFSAEDVERVTVEVPPLSYRLVGRPDIPEPSPAYARLCLRFVAAVALLHGTVDVPHFSSAGLRDGAVHALAARIDVRQDANPDQTAMVPQSIQVALKSGELFDLELEQMPGHPEAPLSREEHLAKFRRNWGYGAVSLAPGSGEELIGLVDGLEEVSDVRGLTRLLVP